MMMDGEQAFALIKDLALKSRRAQVQLGLSSNQARQGVLHTAAKLIRKASTDLLAANQLDEARANAQGMAVAMLDRLRLTPDRIEAMAQGLEEVAALGDPLAKELGHWQRPNGLVIERVATPLGVIGVIFESRPNVAADAAALCLRAGNAVILRGGSDSFHSVKVIGELWQQALLAHGLPAEAVQTVPSSERALVGAMLQAQGLLDVLVPRGGRSLTERVITEARVPVFAHLEGVVQLYIHQGADLAKAEAIAVNAKMRRTSICGAAEALLIDAKIAPSYLPRIAESLIKAGCELRGDEAACRLVPSILKAQEDDWGREFGAAIMAVKIVKDMEEALAYIAKFGSHHTDAIVTEDAAAATRFLREVDSAIVLHNASTQFADGGEFGMGAEIGIATGRLHARGPIGAEQLTCFKYRVYGEGQCRP